MAGSSVIEDKNHQFSLVVKVSSLKGVNLLCNRKTSLENFHPLEGESTFKGFLITKRQKKIQNKSVDYT